MLPPRIESTRVRRRRSRKIWFLIPLIGLIGFLAYRYGEGTYLAIRQRFLPENLQLLESRSSHVEEQLIAHSIRSDDGALPGYTLFSEEEREQIVAYLKDSRRILSFYEGSTETGAALQASAALFQFYELLLYVQLNERSVLDLAGRGFLPSLTGINAETFREKARSSLLLSRKSLAMDPGQRRADDLRLIEAVSDLLYNERTDPHLFDQLIRINRDKIAPGLKPTYAFASLALFARSGNRERLNEILDANSKSGMSQMLRIYALFHARDYIQAMQLARTLMADAQAEPALRSEAARMMGEIFRIQSGAAAGLPYLYQARELHADPFLDELIQQWQAGP